MDKADFSFIVTSFCYLVLSLFCRIGIVDFLVLDIASTFLWGILLITTLIKSRIYLVHTGTMLNRLAILLAIIIFLLSTVITIFYPFI